jgi:hypothetical protein
MNLASLCEKKLIEMLLLMTKKRLALFMQRHIPFGLRDQILVVLSEIMWTNPHFPLFCERERVLKQMCLKIVSHCWKLSLISIAENFLAPLQNYYWMRRIINKWRMSIVCTETDARTRIKYVSPRLNIWLV